MAVFVGINLSHHPETGRPTADGGVAIAIDGVLRYACAEERVSRSKYDGGFQRSLHNGLTALGLTAADIDVVGLVGFGQQVDSQLPDALIEEVRAEVGTHARILYCSSHHEGHAWAAIAQLTISDALIVVIDHTGNIIEPASGEVDDSRAEQTSYYLWRNESLELVSRDHDGPGEVGYGRFYSKVTRYVGFGSYHDAGKLMGLAPFGIAERIGPIPEAYRTVGGSEVTTITDDIFSEDGLADLSEWLRAHGAHRAYLESWPLADITAEGADLAAWGQRSLESSVLRRVLPLVREYVPEHVVVCGGVALNSVLNGVLARELPSKVQIPDSPGDAGLSIGALQFAEFAVGNGLLNGFSPYIGRQYMADEVRAALSLLDSVEYVITELEDPIGAAADALADGQVIGWFRGRSEFGPRALGNRSILCAASNPWVKEKVNGFVKKREWFRPFAPSVLTERADDYFEMGREDSPYMMKTVPARVGRKQEIPSAVHVDGTARVQTVSVDDNPDFYALISAYEHRTGVPVILNTSFNEGGMPLIESPADAIKAYVNFGAGMNRLFIENYEIRRAS
ncbi:MAG TPA: carbamoyltransferase C-terminal domain-containing protein [Enteractinococcus sp.]